MTIGWSRIWRFIKELQRKKIKKKDPCEIWLKFHKFPKGLSEEFVSVMAEALIDIAGFNAKYLNEVVSKFSPLVGIK